MPGQQVVEPGQVAAHGEVDRHEESQDQEHDRTCSVRVRGKFEELWVDVGITVDGILNAVEEKQRGQAEDAADRVEH